MRKVAATAAALVLVAACSGSPTSATDGQLDAVAPRYNGFTMGSGNVSSGGFLGGSGNLDTEAATTGGTVAADSAQDARGGMGGSGN